MTEKKKCEQEWRESYLFRVKRQWDSLWGCQGQVWHGKIEGGKRFPSTHYISISFSLDSFQNEKV